MAECSSADGRKQAARRTSYELATYPACRDYVARATARPAFVKAHADQMTHFAAADRKAE